MISGSGKEGTTLSELRLILQSDLCAGSGEAAGLTVDNDICMDGQGFPYLPSRRLKGVLRDAAEFLQDCGEATKEDVDALFGTEQKAGLFRITDAVLPEIEAFRAYLAEVPEALRRAAAPLNVTRLFTSVRGQTKLENGVAAEGSLRFTRVLDRHNALHPEQDTELLARVELATGANEEFFKLCCKAVRHVGSDRNRGLGNVKLVYDSKKEEQKGITPPEVPEEGGEFVIRYSLSLDAPITLPGCGELLEEIQGRSVIGCLAAQYSPDAPDFADLFLNGNVRWSALTPQVCGVRSLPAPLSLVQIKDEDRYEDRASASPEALKGKKLKTLEGSYLARTQEEPRLVRPGSRTVYHHGHRTETLYMQDSLDAGMLYSGYVEVPTKDLAERVLELLCGACFSFGRSKTAQYGSCSLAAVPQIEKKHVPVCVAAPGDPVWVLLESDLVLFRRGLCVADPAQVRETLAELLHLENRIPEGLQDYCQTRTLSGYQVQWQMPKPQLPALRGGSLFVFCAGSEAIPGVRQLGEFPQEGLGVFRVLTKKELEAIGSPVKGRADVRSAVSGNEGEVLQKAMASAELERLFREAVSELYCARRDLNVRTGTLGRMRQMLAEATDYNNFLERIRSIKDSDAHSDNLVPDREKAELLAEAVRSCTWDAQPYLMGLMGQDAAGLWKKPMLQMIHLRYYGN